MMRKFRRVLFIKLARLVRGEKNVVPCIISNTTKIKGNIADGDIIQIEGKVEGDICCKELIIGVGGVINGNIQAKSLELYGELKGKIKVESLFIAGSAKFIGDASYKTIAIEPGAVLIGQCSNYQDETKTEKATGSKNDTAPKLVA